MRLTGRHIDFERRATAVDEDREFAAETAARATQGVVLGLVGMILETFFGLFSKACG